MAEFCYQCTEDHFGDGAKNDFIMSRENVARHFTHFHALCEGCHIDNPENPDYNHTLVNCDGVCVSEFCLDHSDTHSLDETELLHRKIDQLSKSYLSGTMPHLNEDNHQMSLGNAVRELVRYWEVYKDYMVDSNIGVGMDKPMGGK